MPRRPIKAGISQAYLYPEHLRYCLDSLPAAPGVYLFHGDSTHTMPLYIGKSINIRQRVLSHLRTPDEHRLLQQSRSITYIRTAGEIGALLLEAKLIKEQQPLFNQRLRRTRQLCSLHVAEGAINVVYARDMDFAHTPHLYGIFNSRHSALEALRQLADTQRLCYGSLGLERLAVGKRCFRASIGQCAGRCCGLESKEMFDVRLMQALASLHITCWPYEGAIGIVEKHADTVHIHVVRNWYYVGTATDIHTASQLAKVSAGFDGDSYKILCNALFNDRTEIITL